MATTTFGVGNMFSYTVLTDAIQAIANGIPKILPEAFYSITENVLGDTGKNFSYKGTRRTAQIAPYGSPPRQVNMQSVQGQNFKLLHAIHELIGDQNFLRMVIAMEANPAFSVNRAAVQDELNRQATIYATLFQNLRTAAVQSMIANGKIWFDSSGNLLPTASGADLTIDYGVPTATASVSWATASTEILQDYTNRYMTAYMATGYPWEIAFYGKNVATYMLKNTTLAAYFARHQVWREAIDNTGTIPNGVFGIQWFPAWKMFYEDSGGTLREQFGADNIVFMPAITNQTYAMYQGSYLVPTTYQPLADFQAAAASVREVYGMGRWAEVKRHPHLAFGDTMFDTFLPRLKVPASALIFDTTT